MTNKKYVSGRSFEYRVSYYLRKKGYYTVRSYGSKGLYDIIAVPQSGQTLLIQAKRNGTVPKHELEKLKKYRHKWNGLTLIAYSEHYPRKDGTKSKNTTLKFRTLDGQQWLK